MKQTITTQINSSWKQNQPQFIHEQIKGHMEKDNSTNAQIEQHYIS